MNVNTKSINIRNIIRNKQRKLLVNQKSINKERDKVSTNKKKNKIIQKNRKQIKIKKR